LRGFIYSFALALALHLAFYIPPFEALIGYFGAIPLAGLALLLPKLPPTTIAEILIFVPPLFGLSAHLAFRRGERLFRDSVFTLLSAAWFSYTVGVLHFLCEWQNTGSSGQAACSGLVPNFLRASRPDW
jgi:hypothetical protein